MLLLFFSSVLFCFRTSVFFFFCFASFECLCDMLRWLSPSQHLARYFMKSQTMREGEKAERNPIESNRIVREEKKKNFGWLGLKSKSYIKKIQQNNRSTRRSKKKFVDVRHRPLIIDDDCRCKSCLVPSLSHHWTRRITIFFMTLCFFFVISIDCRQ